MFDRSRQTSERLNEFDRQDLGLLSQIPRTDPVAGAYCLMSLGEESGDLTDQIILRGTKLAAISGLQIALGHADIIGGGANGGGLVFCRELRRNLQRLRLLFRFRRSHFGFDGRPGAWLLGDGRHGLRGRLNIRWLGGSRRTPWSYYPKLRGGG